MKRDWSVPKAIAIGVLALLYGASPIDIIPDVLGPIGWADDGLALVAAGVAIWRILKDRAARRADGTRMDP